MVTKFSLFFLSGDRKNFLWSQRYFFWESFLAISFLDWVQDGIDGLIAGIGTLLFGNLATQIRNGLILEIENVFGEDSFSTFATNT